MAAPETIKQEMITKTLYNVKRHFIEWSEFKIMFRELYFHAIKQASKTKIKIHIKMFRSVLFCKLELSLKYFK